MKLMHSEQIRKLRESAARTQEEINFQKKSLTLDSESSADETIELEPSALLTHQKNSAEFV